jgi:hypothetical protein
MNELVLANRAADWRRLKMLVLDSVSSPITPAGVAGWVKDLQNEMRYESVDGNSVRVMVGNPLAEESAVPTIVFSRLLSVRMVVRAIIPAFIVFGTVRML